MMQNFDEKLDQLQSDGNESKNEKGIQDLKKESMWGPDLAKT